MTITGATIEAIKAELERLGGEGMHGIVVQLANENYDQSPEDWVRVYDGDGYDAFGPATEILAVLKTVPTYVEPVEEDDADQALDAHSKNIWGSLGPFEGNEDVIRELATDKGSTLEGMHYDHVA